MRTLMLLSKTYRHDPRVSKEAEALTAAGHDVTVLEWSRHQPDQPEHERLGDVHVVRTPGTRLMHRLGSDLVRNPLWWHHAADLARSLHEREPFDVVHAHDLDTLGAAVRFATRARKRQPGAKLPQVVFDAHERFDQMITGHVPWPVPAGARLLERRWLRHVDLVITASDNFAEHYRTLTDRPVVVVWNAFGDAPDAYTPTSNESFTAHYIGTLSRDRLFPDIVHAFGGRPELRFVLGGKNEGVFAETKEAAQPYGNVEFLGPVPHEDVLASTRAADIVLAPLDPANPQYRIQVPNKLFDAMCCGRPLVATTGTEAGRFVLEHDVGIAVPYDATAFADAVASLSQDPAACERMGRKGQALARDRFHWAPQAAALNQAYERLVSGQEA